ncbi:MAG: RNase adapter RapZ [Bacillota bacterium]
MSSIREGFNANVVLITGLSGAGKSQAIRTLEDLGYFCVDNLPPALISTFMQLCKQLEEPISKIAMVVDVRGREFFEDLSDALEALETDGIKPAVLFLEANDEALVRRYKETRRRHPLSPQGSTLEVIREEREILSDLRAKATVIIDTSDLTTSEFRKQLVDVFSKTVKFEKLLITIVTFGFKYGLPLDADLVFDVRFLANPHYVAELRPLTGLDERVSKYVFKPTLARSFFNRLTKFIDFLLPNYVDEGKSHLTIAIGCTGGRHRSVALGEALRSHLETKEHTVVVEHRDIERRESGGLNH